MSEEFTRGPWQFEAGAGHAPSRSDGSESRQRQGWPVRRNGISNASYSDTVCENLGDHDLPGPRANINLILAAPDMLAALEYCLGDMARLMGAPNSAYARPNADSISAARAAIAKARGHK